jgi:diguanylate cyclase (GGDEF)-like protein
MTGAYDGFKYPGAVNGDLEAMIKFSNAVAGRRIGSFLVSAGVVALIANAILGVSLGLGVYAMFIVVGVVVFVVSRLFLADKLGTAALRASMFLTWLVAAISILIAPLQGIPFEVLIALYIVSMVFMSCLYIVKTGHSTAMLSIMTALYLISTFEYGTFGLTTALCAVMTLGAVEVTSISRYRSAVYVSTNESKLMSESVIDELTRLKDRAGFRADFSRYLGHDVFVAMADGDGFKRFNDVYGHDVGDAVLVALADTLRDVFGLPGRYDALSGQSYPVDVYRYGGDEFIIIGYFTSQDHVEARLQKLVDVLPTVRNDLIPETMTVSVGYVYGYANDAEDVRMMVKSADRMLYTAKTSGRSCFRGGPYAGEQNSALEVCA